MAERKPSFDTNRQVLGKIYPLDTPFTVILDSSELCNFRCNYCFRSDNDKSKWGYAKDPTVMSKQIFETAVEQIKQFPSEVKQISLSNHGEPLMNRRVPDMVRYIKRQGIPARVSIHTNASLLDRDYALDLADSNIDRIVVSLQGLSSDKYKDICGYDIDYDRFYENLRILYEHKHDTQVNIKIADVALEKGQYEYFYRKFGEISDRIFVETVVPIWEGVRLPEKEEGIKNKYGDSFPKQECCPLIFNTIVVNPIGDVYPCTQLLSEDKLGNITNESLVTLWNSNHRSQLLKGQCTGDRQRVCEHCYIGQNSIYAKEDMIDDYRGEILERLQ